MTLVARIKKIEALLDDGSAHKVEQERQDRIRFAAMLHIWLDCADLPDQWRLAFEQAQRALDALSPLPESPRRRPRSTDHDQQQIDQLTMDTLSEPWYCKGRVHLSSDDLALWAQFASNVSLPQG